jgi:upstream activation factor subunit UAF30
MTPTDAELKAAVKKLVPKVDLQKTGIKSFTKLLAKEFGGIDLKSRAEFIKSALSEAINELDTDESDGSESESEEEVVKKPPKKKAKTAATAGTGAPKGLAVKKEISPKLASFLKQGNEMARTEIVKALWDYIKDNNLQNPENKREIILDDAMREVFGKDTDRFTMFTMVRERL